MTGGIQAIEYLRDNGRLDAPRYRSLLETEDCATCSFLRSEARKVADSVFGPRVFIRGLIEISSHCRNNCLYCGLRAGNSGLKRYRLSAEEVLECCRKGYEAGFRTFVLQGGEDPALDDDLLESLVRSVKSGFPDCAVTLSLGERSKESYRRLKAAGADRYLLRHETYDPAHYSRLHPSPMSRESRLGCLASLKECGYQTGTGFMVGSPWQTVDNIVEDILFIEEFHPEMIGIGPFIHHGATPFADMPDGSVEMTCRLISIFRLMNPRALIPATTALASLEPEGRRKGIQAGANVVMPNLSPEGRRKYYSIYEGKAFSGAEGAEGLAALRNELNAIGCDIAIDRGDYDDKRKYC
ncbi:MAG: [FeFe] hydrogenase H-cluster radical SAM maturase HydE [Bacteroidales bacterium]|nr:[FeFe] hydrogenase H-cluster radical SAM maturase HydE [Bacteroidales bacterium]